MMSPQKLNGSGLDRSGLSKPVKTSSLSHRTDYISLFARLIKYRNSLHMSTGLNIKPLNKRIKVDNELSN